MAFSENLDFSKKLIKDPTTIANVLMEAVSVSKIQDAVSALEY